MCVCTSPRASSNSWALPRVLGPCGDMNRQNVCVSACVVALLCGGLGQGVAGAVADPREGLLAG